MQELIEIKKMEWSKQKEISKEIELLFPDNGEGIRRMQRYSYNLIRMQGCPKESALKIMQQNNLYP